MANIKDATITVNSKVLTDGQLEEKREKVKRWKDFGYNLMQIMYFLSLEVKTLSATFEEKENNYIINLG